ncbi:phosphotransferase enzyme family protein [Flindersiella endophytica]
MYTPTADALARAFGLGRAEELVHVRSGDTDTWRLDTSAGRYFLKGYRDNSAGRFMAGSLRDQLEAAMEFEQLAFHAGVDLPKPIQPAGTVNGRLTEIEGRLFRAYRWVEHRPLRGGDDIAGWLGRTMARIHQLRPLPGSPLPGWWRGAIRSPEDWEECFATATARGKPWAKRASEILPHILERSARIERLLDGTPPPDCVTTHGDFKTHNLLMTPAGPLLVDWDSVRVDSAALEAARVAYIFAGGAELEPIQRVLRAYVDAGGDLAWAGEDALLSVTRHDLQGLYARIQVSLGRQSVEWWMGDNEAVEQDIADLLRDLPSRTERLRALSIQL